MEIRNFYLKGKLIFTDFIYVKSPEFIEKVNKAMFYINKVKNGIIFTGAIIDARIIKGIFSFMIKKLRLFQLLVEFLTNCSQMRLIKNIEQNYIKK